MSRPARILIACTRCKTRKIKCDGATPKCGHCVAKDVECIYAAARQYRGKGRKTKEAEEVSFVDLTQDGPPEKTRQEAPSEGIPVAVVSAAVQAFQPFQPLTTATASGLSQQATPSNIFPSFLLPGAYETHMTQVKSTVGSHHSKQTPAPLMPQEIVQRLLHNSYAEIRLKCPFLGPLEEVLLLLDAQYDASAEIQDASGSALINAVVALAIRQKMAAGAESHISGISMAYYRNATLLLHELLLKTPTRHTVPALRAMAAFAKETPDAHAEAMLVMNAEAMERVTRW